MKELGQMDRKRNVRGRLWKKRETNSENRQENVAMGPKTRPNRDKHRSG